MSRCLKSIICATMFGAISAVELKPVEVDPVDAFANEVFEGVKIFAQNNFIFRNLRFNWVVSALKKGVESNINKLGERSKKDRKKASKEWKTFEDEKLKVVATIANGKLGGGTSYTQAHKAFETNIFTPERDVRNDLEQKYDTKHTALVKKQFEVLDDLNKLSEDAGDFTIKKTNFVGRMLGLNNRYVKTTKSMGEILTDGNNEQPLKAKMKDAIMSMSKANGMDVVKFQKWLITQVGSVESAAGVTKREVTNRSRVWGVLCGVLFIAAFVTTAILTGGVSIIAWICWLLFGTMGMGAAGGVGGGILKYKSMIANAAAGTIVPQTLKLPPLYEFKRDEFNGKCDIYVWKTFGEVELVRAEDVRVPLVDLRDGF